MEARVFVASLVSNYHPWPPASLPSLPLLGILQVPDVVLRSETVLLSLESHNVTTLANLQSKRQASFARHSGLSERVARTRP